MQTTMQEKVPTSSPTVPAKNTPAHDNVLGLVAKNGTNPSALLVSVSALTPLHCMQCVEERVLIRGAVPGLTSSPVGLNDQ